MAVFTLKARDTMPQLQVALKNPDGTPVDLTGSTDYQLHVRVGNGLVFTRTMVPDNDPATGILRYQWAAADWAGSPALPVVTSVKELPMEYEVIAGIVRMTFPNGANDTLKIVGDLG